MRTIANKIKGLTLEIGGDVQPLNKALGEVNKHSKDLKSELRDVERLLKLDPKNTELLAQKQKLLAESVDNTKKKLDTLKDAERQAQEQFRQGKIGEEQYRAIQREVIRTEQELNNLQTQLSNVNNKWKDASDKLGSFGKKATEIGTSMSKNVTAPILAAGTGLIALAKASGNAADRLLDLRDITGLSTDTIQEWQHVATVAGVSAETMTSAVEGLVKKIPQLEAEGGKSTEAMGKLGLSFDKLKRMSPDEQMDKIISKLAGMKNPLERNAIGAQLFGGAWKDLAPILGMGAEKIGEIRKEAYDLGRVLSEDSLVQANDFRIVMDKLTGTIKSAALQIGADLAPMLTDTFIPLIQDKVVPAIKGIVEKIADLIKWFADLSPSMQKFIGFMLLIVVSIGPVLVIIGNLATGISWLMNLFTLLGPLIAGIGGFSGIAAIGVGAFNTAMAVLLSPITLVIAAVVALIAIIVLLVKHWDKVVAVTKKLGEIMIDNWVKVFDWTKNTFKKIYETVLEWINKAIDFVKELPEKMVQAGKDIIQGIIDGIKEKFQALKDGIKNIADSITGTFKKILGIASPSKVFRGFGENVGDGLALGIKDSLSNLKAVSLEMTNTVTPNMKNGTSSISNSTNSTMQEVKQDIIVNVKADDLNQVADVIRLFDGFKQTKRAGVV